MYRIDNDKIEKESYFDTRQKLVESTGLEMQKMLKWLMKLLVGTIRFRKKVEKYEKIVVVHLQMNLNLNFPFL